MLRLRLAVPKDGLRWSDPEQWHITLRFFGDVEAKALPEIAGAVGQIRISSPDLRIEQLGSFAAKGILFAEVFGTHDLFDVQAQVEGAAIRCGFAPESRPFHPHITLARSRNQTGLSSLQRLTKPEVPSFGAALSWHADHLRLYESELRAGGAQYRTLVEVALRSELQDEPKSRVHG